MEADPQWIILYYLFLYLGIVQFVERLQETKFMIIGIEYPKSLQDSQLSARGDDKEEIENEVSLIYQKMAKLWEKNDRVTLVVPSNTHSEGKVKI